MRRSCMPSSLHATAFGAVLLAVVMPGAEALSNVAPAPNSTDVCVDTTLQLKFDTVPVLGTSGQVRIYSASGTLVDRLDLSSSFVDTMGPKGSEYVRRVVYKAIEIDGKTAYIKPHNSILDYATTYRVEVDSTVFVNATLSGAAFAGVSASDSWTFTTTSDVPMGATVVVDAAGTADFCTVQGGLNYVMANVAANASAMVYVKNGIYREVLWVYAKNNLVLRGETRDGTVVKVLNGNGMNGYTGNRNLRNSTLVQGGRAVFLAELSDMLVIDSITLNNTKLRDNTGDQAEALTFTAGSKDRLVVQNAAFYSEQDTLQINGFAWFYDTLVAGNVDFIWGASKACVFEACEIRSVGDSKTLLTTGLYGMIIQARVPSINDTGFVFLDSKLTYGRGPHPAGLVPGPESVYLGRSAGSTSMFDNVAYVNCQMDQHIKAIGWAGTGQYNNQPTPNPATPTATTGWREYGTTDMDGAPMNLSARLETHILTEAEYKSQFSSRAGIFAKYGWSPSTFGAYGGLGAVVSPTGAAGQAVCPDTVLTITFDSAPTLGTSGQVRVYAAADGTLVDTLDASAAFVDTMGPKGSEYVRRVVYKAIEIEGKMAYIKLHNSILDYETSYFVEVDGSVFAGAVLKGTPFVGINKYDGWAFATRKATASGASVTVDAAGGGNFCTVQGALNYVMANVAADTAATVSIANGVYRELLWLRRKSNVRIQGASRDGTVVRALNKGAMNSGSSSQFRNTTTATGGRYVFLVEQSDLLTFDSFTVNNTHLRDGNGDQAETLYFAAPNDERFTAVNAAFYSEQDTLLLEGFCWFYRSLVAGNVDFIWGYVKAALFEESEIRSVGDSKLRTDLFGMIVQSRVRSIGDKGFVFLNSRLTRGRGPHPTAPVPWDESVYLGRSAGTTSAFDNVLYANCKMDAHIKSIGWAGTGQYNNQPTPNPETATATAGWREYGSTDLAGNALSLGSRYAGQSRILSKAEFEDGWSTRAQIFSQYKSGAGWAPVPTGVAATNDLAIQGYASATSDAGSTVTALNDGSFATAWSPAGTTGSVTIKFNAPTAVDSVQVTETDGKTYRIGSWSLVNADTGAVLQSGYGLYGAMQFSKVTLSAITFVVGSAWTTPSIAEFEVFSTPAKCTAPIALWGGCLNQGGCCAGHYVCYEANPWYAQCRESCSTSEMSGWTCNVLA